MMKEEFKRLIESMIDDNYREIEAAYMAADEGVNKMLFARSFFMQGLNWSQQVVEARATVTRYSEEIKKLNAKVAEANCLLDSLMRI